MALTATTAATVTPSGNRTAAVPSPPLDRPRGAARLGDGCARASPYAALGQRPGGRRIAGRPSVAGAGAHPGVHQPQIVDDGGRHDRHDDFGRNSKADAPFLQPRHHPRRRIQSEGAAPAKGHREELVHAAGRLQQVRLPRSGRPAAHVNAPHGPLPAEDYSAARSVFQVGVVPGLDAWALR